MTDRAVMVEHYQRLLIALPEPMVVLTTAGRVLTYNRAAARLLEITRFPNLQDCVTIPAELFLAYLRRCSRSKEFLISAFDMKTLRGEIVLTTEGCVLEPRSEDREALILLRLAPRWSTNTKFKILQDQIDRLNEEAGKRLRAEYDLRTQKKWLEVTLASIGDAVITTDNNCVITYLNPVAEQMTAWPAKEAIGQPLNKVFVVINEGTRKLVENPAETALRDRRTVALANHSVLITREGREINIEDTAAPISTDEEIRGAVLVFHDVSERRELEKQLLKRAQTLALINQRKNEFLTMLAHELRSPLSPINNAVQIITLQSSTPPEIAEPLAVIGRQVRQLRRLIDDMLDVSRITSGKMKLIREAVDFNIVVRTTCQDFSDQFFNQGIRFQFTLPDTPVWIYADPHRITQVLHNILLNALKFTPSEGFVHLQLTVADTAVLVLTDTGIGIDESLMPVLFEPFTQALQSLDRSKGGLGLGLSLVKGIVDLHGGAISVSSAGVHKGTTVTLELPTAVATDAAAPEPDTFTTLAGRRILLVEDDVDAGNTMTNLLRLLGHEVHLARSGPEGLEKAIAIAPDLIICDIGLPGLDGFGVAVKLRENSLTSGIPLVALTGYGGPEFVEQAKHAGFALHITKPATLTDIHDAVVLSMPRSENQ